MRVSRILALAAICAIFATGCDAVRSALGKPTSKDIAALRAQREQMQHTGDSLATEMGVTDIDSTIVAVAASEGDSSSAANPAVAPLYTVAENQEVSATSEEPSDGRQGSQADKQGEEEFVAEGLAEGFWVVLGSFKNEENARYFYNSLSASGTEVEMVKMKNGFTAVMICHGNSYEESYRKMLDFYKNEKRPEDIWIYNTAKQMHIE